MQLPVSTEEEKKIREYFEANNLKAGKFVKTLILSAIAAKEAN